MSALPRIILSSRNKHKIGEIAELMAPHGIQLIGVESFPGVPEVEEDGDSFSANAAKKASIVAKRLGEWVIAEDSGLVVNALDGAPGIYSARFANHPQPGTLAADEANNQKLLNDLASVSDEARTAYYVCYSVLSDPTGRIRVESEGRCCGRILRTYHGSHGFGYDPLFMIPEYHRTFGELAPAVKRHVSHRARSFERLIPRIVQLFGQI